MKNFKPYIFAALFAAIIFVFTFATNLRIPLPNGGYIHFGDSIIFIAACIIPTPFAIIASAVGTGFSDLLSGAAIWVPFTVVIKGLMAFVFIKSINVNKIFTLNTFVRAIIATVINFVLYYFAEVIIVGNFIAPLVSLPFGLIQSGGSIVLFILIAVSLDKVKFKDTLKRIR